MVMKKILFYMLAVIVVILGVTVRAEAKSENVKVYAGDTKTIQTLQNKKIKKITVKNSKKSVVTVKRIKKKKKWKIQITGRKKGTATVQIKVSYKKKTRTYKYKITVKKKPVIRDNDDLDDGGTAPQNKDKTEETINTGYTYELEVLSEGGAIYGEGISYPKGMGAAHINPSNGLAVLYIKTEDPDMKNISLWSDKSQARKNMFLPPEKDYQLVVRRFKYADVHYLNYNAEDIFQQVAGGYIITVSFDERDEIGTNNIILKKKIGEKYYLVKGGTFQVEVLDPIPYENAFIDKMISEVQIPDTDEIRETYTMLDGMTEDGVIKYYILNKLCSKIRTEWRYYSSFSLVQDHHWWTSDGKAGTVDCFVTTYIMMRFTDKLGVDSEGTYAGYLNHYYTTVTIEGREFEFDACPPSSLQNDFEWDFII